MPSKEHMNVLEGNTMSPLDMLIFFFFILVTIKAVSANIDYWKNVDDEIAESKSSRRAPAASLSRTVRTGRPSSVRVTPIKRVNTPVTATTSHNRQYHLKDKGAA